jgi:transcriptional regulator with XRE-family HTH domain
LRQQFPGSCADLGDRAAPASRQQFDTLGLVTDRERTPPTLGDIIRQQRELAALPMRQLAEMVGISNPYLSQIERGLRAPSEQVLDAIARSLRTSADALYEQAASVEEEPPDRSAVLTAIDEDPDLTARQRQALVEVYLALTEMTRARRRRRGRQQDVGQDAGSEKPEADEGPGLSG